MDEEKYTDSDTYQQEIAAQYKKRVAKFPVTEVVRALSLMGIAIDPHSVEEAVVGNVNATYLTPTLVIKVNQNREEVDYYSNTLISTKLAKEFPVVNVVAYDNFEKTDYEVLVMERAKGTLLLDDIFELNPEVQESLFRQILSVVKAMSTVEFKDFGNVNTNSSFPTYTDYLRYTFTDNVRQIREQGLCEENDIVKVEKYFLERVGIFQNEKSVFVHADLHMGNVLHDGDRLTAIIDFDHSLKAPPARSLLSLLGFIDNPSQFVEGTKYFSKYKGKDFYNLLPILKEELSEVFSDPLIVQKLNILGIREGIDLIAANWSTAFNRHLIRMIVDNELAENDVDLQKSYYGKVLGH